ncbi:MAG TPA: RDD family protein [Solirubrobacteraceae bacterium]
MRAFIVGIVIFAGALLAAEDGVTAGFFLGVYVIAPLYAPVVMSRLDGQTFGHRAMETRIVTRSGEPVTGWNAFKREFLVKNLVVETLGGLFSLGILPIVNYLWPLWDGRDEALHDKMCDTRVVKA